MFMSQNQRSIGKIAVTSLLVLLAPALVTAQTTVLAGRTPFQRQVTLSAAAGSTGGFAAVTVPPNSRVVIEYVSVSGTVPTGQKLSTCIQTTVQQADAAYWLVTAVQETADGVDRLVGNQTMKVHAEGPEFHVVFWRAKPDGPSQVTFNIAGYTEPI